MKCILLTSAFLLSVFFMHAQNANAIAEKIAKKMKDSLSLSSNQQAAILGINLQLHEQKKQAFARYENLDSLGKKIQSIENTRDSLYRPIMGAETFSLYKRKKKNLVNNN